MTHSVLRPDIADTEPSEIVNVDFAIVRKFERATLVIFAKGILVDFSIFR